MAGTDDDTNNLSIIMTARQLNPNLFRAARQNDRDNDRILAAARLDLTMQRSGILANRILILISTPLLATFLREGRHQSEERAHGLTERLAPLTGEETPDLWTVTLTPGETPPLSAVLERGETVQLGQLLADHFDRKPHLQVLPLLRVHGGEVSLLRTRVRCSRPAIVCSFAGDSVWSRACSGRSTTPIRYVICAPGKYGRKAPSGNGCAASETPGRNSVPTAVA